MTCKQIFLCIFISIAVFTPFYGETMRLSVKPLPDLFFKNAIPGVSPLLKDRNSYLVVGTVNQPDFSIENPSEIKLSFSESDIPLLIDESSFYSEFDASAINSVRIAFLIPKDFTNTSSLKLSWGGDIHMSNLAVKEMPVYSGSKNNYRTFTLEKIAENKESGTYAATLEVIVDDYADKYFVWYFFPMALILGLLTVRRFFFP